MKSNIIQFSNLLHHNKFYETILSWFKQNQRNLYWRENRKIYLTYLTEVMLQQTTVSTVQNKLSSILKEFPDFKSFKSKKIDDFLKCWSGLGYYNRAINFYKSVSIIKINKKIQNKTRAEKIKILKHENEKHPHIPYILR